MQLLGDNAYGWRVPSVIFGLAAIVLLYGIVRRLHPNPYVALGAAFLLSFDNMVFIHSRIFTLDIFQVACMLLGMYFYVRKRPVLGGAGFALAALCKISGSFGVAIAIGFEALMLFRGDVPWRVAWRAAVSRAAIVAVTSVLVFLPLLGVMDHFWTTYSNPIDHVERIITFGAALRRNAPSGIESYPWQWLWNQNQIPYIEVDQEVKAGDQVLEKRPLVLFLGALNPYVLGLLPFGLAFAAYAWWQRQKVGALGALTVAWFFLSYGPFFATTLFQQRISYIFYFLPTVPAVVMGGALFLWGANLPRLVRWAALAAVLMGFYGLFPFRPVP